ncbi:DEAD/DEAH box helicase [Bathymodiolus septemdierum thioautotrophic gill symbiont]|uniref:DEAD/DEAH box helicase n=1 Tax=endosymbiont of Bathymodiolus septemdierum str. Myojin knoll TaxID=1303921 RepID=A0A0N7KBA5_9GAMM|nr:DEAD/DEAH box helicase [Bathymodiolus septemdierum thioautotrophic gill symbiont]BAS67471.1 DEAD/DEAH box helicase [endosymbiont of Bathymodiolus septemdierum str. Myojin knoll]
MASAIEEIEKAIQQAIATGFRGRLLERGLARSMIWVDGELPDGSPNFAPRLSYDLLSYGYSLLSLAIRLTELNGNPEFARAAFEKAATAITDVIHNGNPDDPEKGFHKVLAASSYHLGRFSAKAFSLLNHNIENENLSRIEKMLSLLMLRQFAALETSVLAWKESGLGSDNSLAEKIDFEIDQLNGQLESEDRPEEYGIASIELPIIDLAITDNYYSAIYEFLFALEIGNIALLESAINRIENSLSITTELNMLPQWWVLRITKYLFRDLWESSFHTVLPVTPDQENSEDWALLRWLFIASLFKRNKAEIDLWPSQLEGARRAVNDVDDLVVSLPTSAGKTRIAELCILRCLSIGKRVLFITPLRALSAQTEASLRKTFLPLGKSVSSLYGSIGTSDFEQNVIKSKDIVVGTPEKLDFALRNDPSLIDDVGLVVLDEGHMIGLSEREISYEVQIQRLLKRDDAEQRRIVCLSAILPDGDQLEDFVGWLRRDKEGGAIQSLWRPTDLRFGEIVWQANTGRINFTIGEEKPFIPNYIHPFIPPVGRRSTPFPKNKKELTLAATWRLVQDNHTVLIYCPEKRSVNSFARDIIDLHKREALDSVLSVPLQQLDLAIVLGDEWLGDGHPIVECLKIGVAVHHGALPTPFRKEMEKLLREGILKVTVSSPTLAQGLNLSATAVIVYSLTRNKNIIDASEFKNVIGRAGRAFVDTHGLVLYPIFERHDWFRTQWRRLVEDTKARNMESGLALLVITLVSRIAQSIGNSDINGLLESDINGLLESDINGLLEYVLNNTQAWGFPNVANETTEQIKAQKIAWDKHIVSLDTALLSMLGEEDVSIIDIPNALDAILHSSLWQRSLNRHDEEKKGLKGLFDSVLAQRAKYIWNVTTTFQRKGYFLAGVGLDTGQRLDAISPQANVLLVNANGYISANEQQLAIARIIQLAELVFDIAPFTPRNLPDDWREILAVWLRGEILTEHEFNDINEALMFIEDGLIYRLPWGLEAIRVRAQANEDVIGDSATIDDYEVGLVVPAIENGTLNRSAALLMQAGFNSRKAAIHAVSSTNASFTTGVQLKAWLNSVEVFDLAIEPDWPTPETSNLWRDFIKEYDPKPETTWKLANSIISVVWINNYNPVAGRFVKLHNLKKGNTLILGSDGELIGSIANYRYKLLDGGIYRSSIHSDTSYIDVRYWGAEGSPFDYHV